MSHAPYHTFRDMLATKYPDCGHALWEPSPGGLYDAVEVGDVGFIRNGCFHRLFNVFLPGDDPSHGNFGVPEGHQPLRLNAATFIHRSMDGTIDFCSTHASLYRERDVYASGPDDDLHVTISSPGRRGAALSLPTHAQREDTIAKGDFGKWIVKNIDHWFAFAVGLGLGINRMQDIILVTGRHCAKSWINVAFSEGPGDAEVSFGLQVSGASNLNIEQRRLRGNAVLKLGPKGSNLPENQCVFVRGFRVVRILNIWPRLRGGAGPAPSSHEHEDKYDEQLLPIGTFGHIDYQDPLHVLLEYITDNSPGCDMALVHDDDLAAIDGAFLDNPRPDEMRKRLQESMLEIRQAKMQRDIFPGNRSGSETVASAKVAMLSRDEIQVPPGATNLPSYALNVSYRTALNYMQRDAYAILVSTYILLPISVFLPTRDIEMWPPSFVIVWFLGFVFTITSAFFAILIRRWAQPQRLVPVLRHVNVIAIMKYTLKFARQLQNISALCAIFGLVIAFSIETDDMIIIVLTLLSLIGVSYVLLVPT